MKSVRDLQRLETKTRGERKNTTHVKITFICG